MLRKRERLALHGTGRNAYAHCVAHVSLLDDVAVLSAIDAGYQPVCGVSRRPRIPEDVVPGCDLAGDLARHIIPPCLGVEGVRG